eukprot:TRINITY_DN1488_c0_g1_i2.p2 TRINITY_DN1488_c0_g1~~TRINITY_DN1488_c0_g1_i2.p2  ORF type:complete len:121 (+),score=26.42 TRINITY_DN1488_c0_g1_i2:48-410(+)
MDQLVKQQHSILYRRQPRPMIPSVAQKERGRMLFVWSVASLPKMGNPYFLSMSKPLGLRTKTEVGEQQYGNKDRNKQAAMHKAHEPKTRTQTVTSGSRTPLKVPLTNTHMRSTTIAAEAK